MMQYDEKNLEYDLLLGESYRILLSEVRTWT